MDSIMPKYNHMKLLAIIATVPIFYFALIGNGHAGNLGAGDIQATILGETVPENQENSGIVSSSSSCGPERLLPVEVCEVGQGILCINSPEASFKGEYAIIKGTVDRRTSVFSHIRAYYQHEYTKILEELSLDEWAGEKCWELGWENEYNGCIDQGGFFAVKIPLTELGPYTIMIDAVSVDGVAVSKSVRTSRVIEPAISLEDITLSPDPSFTGNSINAGKINVNVDLLHDCKFCDFIGTSTGGVMVTVKNFIELPEGGTKIISKKSDIAAGGKYDICVPVAKGTNRLFVGACNASVEGSCPEVRGISFNVTGESSDIGIISPDLSKRFIEAKDDPYIPLQFTVNNGEEICSMEDVVVRWNKNEPLSVCPPVNGVFSASLTPEVGINALTIEAGGEAGATSETYIFGYGKLVNPYRVQDGGWIKDAFGIHLGSDFMNRTMRPLINEFLNSDGLVSAIKNVFGSATATETPDSGSAKSEEAVRQILNDIPHCSAGGGRLGTKKIELIGTPGLGSVDVETLGFGADGVGFKMDLTDLELSLRAYDDSDGNGRPDGAVLPLRIVFKKAKVDGKLKITGSGDKQIFLLTGDHDFCDFQSAAFCEEKPALLMPRNIVGGATSRGDFVQCDTTSQLVNEETREACGDLNAINAMTGVLNSELLKIINDLIYCGGSSRLTYAIREGLKSFVIKQKLMKDEPFMAEVGFSTGDGRFETAEAGLTAIVPARFGGRRALPDISPQIRGEGVGVIVNPIAPVQRMENKISDGIGLALSVDWLNELLFQLAFQKEGRGILDWDIDDLFFQKLGFDFVEQCDAFVAKTPADKPSALCQLRPRVGELLGTDLTINGYLGSKQPLRMVLKGSRSLAPHLKIYEADVPYKLPPIPGVDEVQYEQRRVNVAELQIPDVEISFYALAIDEAAGRDVYGNPMLLLDENGNPVVLSIVEGSVEPVPIIRAKMSVFLVIEIGEIVTDPNDTTLFAVKIRPVPELTQIIFGKIQGGNSTIVGDDNILSAFKQKLRYGVDIYGDTDNPQYINLPKGITLDFFEETEYRDLFDRLGLEKLRFGRDGFQFSLDMPMDRINLTLKPELK